MFAKFYYLHSDSTVLYWTCNKVSGTFIPSPSWCMWIIPGTEDE